MCALFGIHDYGDCFTNRQKNIIMAVLSQECETRGTDATGIAYVKNDKTQVFKRPFPAHRMRYNIPAKVKTVMGHTRMTTQGTEKKNCNNHPFFGRVKNNTFALAHNGILHNDIDIRKTMKLPKTSIETDSYIAVQLIEQENSISFDSLQKVAETVRGSFVFTVLDKHDNLYFVRGDNPICVYHFADKGFYLYASTEEILQKSLVRLGIDKWYRHRVPIDTGDILRIDNTGDIDKSKFKVVEYYQTHLYGYYPHHEYDYGWSIVPGKNNSDEYEQYVMMLKQTAQMYGYTPADVDDLLAEGFTPEEIEEMIYCGDIYENEIIYQRVGG